MNKLLKRLRSVYLLNRLTAIILKYFNLSSLYPKWPLKGRVRLKVLNQTVSFYSDCDDHLISKYYYSGFDEEIYEIESLESIIKHSGTFLDIGSYNGLFSIILGKKYPRLNIHAFEPHQSNYNRLNQNISLNKANNILSHNLGLSDETGTHEFFSPEDNSLTTVSSFKSVFYNRHSNTPSASTEVDVTTIDKFCQENMVAPQFIKIDVEGNEYEVINGAQKVISKYLPVILIEIFTRKHNSEEDFKKNSPKIFFIETYFSHLNYVFYYLESGKLVRIDSLNRNGIGRNFLFIPK